MIDFFCPTHGLVVGAPAGSRVECRCGAECSPEGVKPADYRRQVLAAKRQRRKRDRATL